MIKQCCSCGELYDSKDMPTVVPGMINCHKCGKAVTTIKEDKLRVLAVRQPWASLIAEGFKDLEVRSQNTNIRGPIAIYASRTKPVDSELEHYFKFMHRRLLPIPPLMQGKIIATADLKASFPVGCQEAFRTLEVNHLNPLSYYREGLHFWEMGTVQKVEPVEHKFKGSIVWGKVDKDLIKVI